MSSAKVPERPARKARLAIELGAPLMDRVIARVEEQGMAILGGPGLHEPRPIPGDALKRLRSSRDKNKLSPSLSRWLAFDGSWLESLGWFASMSPVRFAPKTLAELASLQFGPGAAEGGAFAAFSDRFRGELYPLVARGASRTALYICAPDSAGEHAVMTLDLEDGPHVALLYPGFDVFMACLVGLLDPSTWTDVTRSRTYATRMREQQYRGFSSKTEYRLEDLPSERPAPPLHADGDLVPGGFEVSLNPFTGMKHLVPRRKKRLAPR